MQTDRWRFPVWLLYALLCIFWWGLWGFLSKIGSVAASPLQMQILFTLGMLPVAFGMLLQMRWKLDHNRGGVTYGLLSGIATGLGTLGYYAALREQNASVVTPLTGVFPLLTVVLAFVVLRERLNKVQMGGMLLALASIVILSI
jgi:transporter family protein